MKSEERWPVLDALRGAALLSMIAYHALYDHYVVFGARPGWPALPLVVLWQRLGAGLFFFISGFCFELGSHRWQGGLKLCLWGALISAVTCFFFPEQAILYGVLTFLGLAALLALGSAPLLRRLPPQSGLIFSLLAYFLTKDIDGGAARFGAFSLWHWPAFLYRDELAVLGFHGPSFFSADYVPLLPHIFVYFAGFFAYRLFCGGERPAWSRFLNAGPLTWLGRRSLFVYLLHQPLLLALFYLFYR